MKVIFLQYFPGWTKSLIGRVDSQFYMCMHQWMSLHSFFIPVFASQ
ncbi:hypothetical protein CSC02_2575 [Enterobacter hormaechei subsp. hoffmannii]|nr:hypothetical protein CSC02_2575 [Enterobacter hormaechei subsp. hoffmannii]